MGEHYPQSIKNSSKGNQIFINNIKSIEHTLYLKAFIGTPLFIHWLELAIEEGVLFKTHALF